MDCGGGVEVVEFAGVGSEVGGGDVAEVDCVRAVGGEEVGCCAADAEGGRGAGYDDDFVFVAAVFIFDEYGCVVGRRCEVIEDEM